MVKRIEVPEKVDIWEKMPDEMKTDITAQCQIERISIEEYLLRGVSSSLEADIHRTYWEEIGKRIELEGKVTPISRRD